MAGPVRDASVPTLSSAPDLQYKLTAINALKGQVMKQIKGQANPATVDEVLKRLLGS